MDSAWVARRLTASATMRQPGFVNLWAGLTVSLLGAQISGVALPLTAILPDANAKLEVSRSLAQVVGPGLGGALVQLIGAPLAVSLDSVAFAIDALLVSRIRLSEPRSVRKAHVGTVGRELKEGLAWVFGHPLLRPIQLSSMCFVGANSVWSTLYLLFLTREIHLEAWQIGLLLAAGGPGTLLGALVANRVIGRSGFGPALVVTQIAAASSFLLTPLAGVLPVVVAVGVLAMAAFVAGVMITIGNVGELTLRQSVTPARLQGRMNATMRSLNWSTAAVGALIGGSLGDHLGLAPALVVGATASVLSAGWLIWSPIRDLSDLKSFIPDAPGEVG